LHKNNAVNLGTNEFTVAQRSHKIIVVFIMGCWPFYLKAQKPFQQPKTMQQVIGRNTSEHQAWVYRSTPSYVKNMVLKLSAFPDPTRGRYSYPGYLKNEKLTRQSFHLVPKNYVQTLGFFCTKEFQLQKLTTVPFRFRLGSLDYVDWMEQKPNAVKLK
jgi:hypothetical protein